MARRGPRVARCSARSSTASPHAPAHRVGELHLAGGARRLRLVLTNSSRGLSGRYYGGNQIMTRSRTSHASGKSLSGEHATSSHAGQANLGVYQALLEPGTRSRMRLDTADLTHGSLRPSPQGVALRVLRSHRASEDPDTPGEVIDWTGRPPGKTERPKLIVRGDRLRAHDRPGALPRDRDEVGPTSCSTRPPAGHRRGVHRARRDRRRHDFTTHKTLRGRARGDRVRATGQTHRLGDLPWPPGGPSNTCGGQAWVRRAATPDFRRYPPRWCQRQGPRTSLKAAGFRLVSGHRQPHVLSTCVPSTPS